MRTIILALIVSLSVGCASTIYPTTIAQVADDGTKVVQAAHQISLSAQSLSASIPTVLTVPQAAVIVQGAYQIEVDGQKLAALLTTYSQIKGTAQAPITAASIDALIGDMDAALATVNKAIPVGTASAITSLAASILSLIGQIKSGLLLAGA